MFLEITLYPNTRVLNFYKCKGQQFIKPGSHYQPPTYLLHNI